MRGYGSPGIRPPSAVQRQIGNVQGKVRRFAGRRWPVNSTAPRRYHDNLDPALLESMPQPLTDRQHAFARLMARGARPVEAFKRAGYAPRHARRTVHRLLRDPRILDAIESTERRIYAGKLAGIRARIDQLTARFNKPRRWESRDPPTCTPARTRERT